MIIKLSKRQINEVRYIDAANRDMTSRMDRPYRKDWQEKYNQQPITNDDKIRVYHGCSIKTALDICQNGTSGKELHPRTYSYENGMNPLGIFVTVNFEKAKDFGYDPKAMCILEFTVKASDLETPVWNNSDSYFGQGSNPQPFRDADERKAQKNKYDDDARNVPDEDYFDFSKKKDIKLDKSYIRNSDKPAMAKSIFDNYEHQALFMGDLNPNMIKYVWVCENGQSQYQRYTEKDFLRKYGNVKGIQKKSMRFKKEKLFQPNEGVKSWDEVINRIVKQDEGQPWAMSREEIIDTLREYHVMDNPTSDFALSYIKQIFWPRQIIQLYGKDFFNKYFNRLEQDFNENYIYDKSFPLTEGSWGYEPTQNDTTLDIINDWYKQGFDLLLDTSSDCNDGSSAWNYIGLIIHLIKTIVDSDETGSFEPSLYLKDSGLFERIDELLDLCEDDKTWLESWDEPSKIKQSLKKIRKEVDKYRKIVDKRTN